MEARYVHTPAVTPEAGPKQAEDTTPVAEPPRPFLQRVEAQIRMHPNLFVLGGFVGGLLLGIWARR